MFIVGKILDKMMFPYTNISANYHLTFNVAIRNTFFINVKNLLKIIAIWFKIKLTIRKVEFPINEHLIVLVSGIVFICNPFQRCYESGIIIMSYKWHGFKSTKLKGLEGTKQFTQFHTTSKWQNKLLTCLLDLEAHDFSHRAICSSHL